MGAFIGQVEHDYFRVPPMTPEQGSRFLPQNCQGFKRVKVKTTNILIQLPRMGKTDLDPFASRV